MQHAAAALNLLFTQNRQRIFARITGVDDDRLIQRDPGSDMFPERALLLIFGLWLIVIIQPGLTERYHLRIGREPAKLLNVIGLFLIQRMHAAGERNIFPLADQALQGMETRQRSGDSQHKFHITCRRFSDHIIKVTMVLSIIQAIEMAMGIHNKHNYSQIGLADQRRLLFIRPAQKLIGQQ